MFNSLNRNKAALAAGASLAVVAALSLGATAARANPENGRVIRGEASVSGEGTNAVTVDQRSDRAILNWDSFSIDSGEAVNFVQPGSHSVAVNRVTGQDPSNIMGSLTANGQVVLINRNGIAFGRDSRVDVAGLVASTADINDDSFMAGGDTLRFDQSSTDMNEIVVNGHISIKDAGLAAFVAPHVRNNGVIVANLGRVALGAGTGFSVDLFGDGLISFAPGDEIGATASSALGDGIKALVESSGEIRASGGQVLLTAAAARDIVHSSVNVSGLVSAASATRVGGKIVLSGPGKVAVEGNGTLDVSSDAAKGGTVKILGDTSALLDAARIDATGASGGGEVLVGGNYLGQGPETNANTTLMAPDASIDASATGDGHGGKVILWSNDYTNAWGTILARGGIDGGNGGFVETSSKNVLNMVGTVNAGATVGRGGTWLLDPGDIIISDGAESGAGFNPNSSYYKPGEDSQVINSTINAGNIESALANNDVFITTGNEDGYSITQNANIEWSSQYGLTLSAGGNLNIAASIINGGTGSITLLAAQGYHDRQVQIENSTISTNGGDIHIYGGLDSAAASTGYRGSVGIQTTASLNSNGGDIIISNSTAGAGGARAIDIRGSIAAGAGDISVTGYGRTGADNGQNTAVTLEDLTLTGGNINVYADTQGSGSERMGIRLVDTVDIRASGDLSLTGKARGGTSTLSSGSGMGIATAGDFGATNVTLYADGNITLDGTATTTDRFAVDLRRTGASTTGKVRIGYTDEGDVSSGDITIKGTATGTGGLYLGGQTLVRTNGGDFTMGGTQSSVGQVIFGQVNFDNATDYGAVTLGTSTATLYNTPDGASPTDFSVSAADGLTLVTRGDLNLNYSVANTASTGGIDLLAARSADGLLSLQDNKSLTASGDIRLLAGVESDLTTATGYKAAVGKRPGSTITSTNGSVSIANSSSGTPYLRGADLHGTITANNGNVTIKGYGSPTENGEEDTALTLENLTVRAQNIDIFGDSQGTGVGRIGVRLVYDVDLQATQDLSITGISYGGGAADASAGDGITTCSCGVNNLTLYAGGNLQLEGRASGSQGDAVNLAISNGSNAVKIGYVDDTTITTGNIEIIGNAQQWINLTNGATIRTNGGNVTIGDNGASLKTVRITNTTIDPNYTYGTITLGGANTRDTLITGGAVSYAATGAINLIDYNGIDIGSNFTNTAAGGDINILTATGADGILQVLDNIAITTNGGDINLLSGIAPDLTTDSGFRGSVLLGSNASLATSGGDIKVANSEVGNTGERGLSLNGNLNAGAGNVTLAGYRNNGANGNLEALALAALTIRAKDVDIKGVSTAVEGHGIQFNLTSDIQATGNLNIYGSSDTRAGIVTFYGGAINSTLFAEGNTVIEGVSPSDEGSIALISGTSSPVFRIGYTADNKITTGDISLIGSGGGIVLDYTSGTSTQTIKSNGGDLTIGDSGTALGTIQFKKESIDSSSNFGTITLGGVNTTNTYIYGGGEIRWAASDSITLIEKDGIGFGASLTNTATGGDIDFYIATGADGTLDLSSGFAFTADGNVNLHAGLLPDGTASGFNGSIALGDNSRVNAGDDITLRATSSIGLGTGTRLIAADGDIMVSTEGTGVFTNYAGASALSAANGRWVVYADDPANTAFGGLVSGNSAIWNQADYDTLVANLAANTVPGNRFAFASIPVTTGGYTVDTANSPNKTYGDTISSSANWNRFTITGNSSVTDLGAGTAYLTNDLEGLFAVTTDSAGFAATADAGTYDVTVSGAATFNGQAVTYLSNGELIVDPRVVTLTGSQVYDRTTTIQGASLTAGGLVNGDTVTVGGSAANAIANANVGNHEIISTTGLTLSNSNYTVVGATGDVDITKATITVDLTGTVSKVYNATDVATLTSGNYSLSGVYSGDAVTLNNPTAGLYDNKNVGTGKAVSVDGLSISGGASGNYQLASTSVSGNVGTITAAQLSVTGVTAQDKVYNANTNAILTGGSVTGFSGDDVSLVTTGASGTFDKKDVDTNIAVTAGGYTLDGDDAGNYTIVQPTGLTADITPAQIFVTGVTAQDKVYNANTNAILTGGSVSGYSGDDVSLVTTGAGGTFEQKDVGTGLAVDADGYTLDGDDAGNYTIVQPTGLTADITAAQLFVTGVTAQDKVYNANTNAILTGGSVSGFSGDDVSLVTTGATGTFEQKDVGTGLAVDADGYTLDGGDAGNYTIVQPTGLTADITAAQLFVTGVTAQDKVYNADRVAVLTGGSVSGFSGDDVSLVTTGATGTFDQKNVGTGIAVDADGYTLDGDDAGNYTIVQPTGLTADITKATITVDLTGTVSKVYNASDAATLTSGNYSLSGVYSGDAVTLNNPTAGLYDNKNVGTGKAVSVDGLSISGGASGNYQLASTSVSGNVGTITAAQLSVTGVTAQDKVYNANTNAILTGGSVTGFSGDDVSLITTGASGTFDKKDVDTNIAVTADGYTLDGDDAGNYTIVQPTGLTADITAAQLFVTGVTAQDKVYNANTNAILTGGSVSGYSGDDVSLVTTGASGTFEQKDVGTGLAVDADGYTLDGDDAGNYTIVQPTGLTADITPYALTLAYDVADKVYDGTADADATVISDDRFAGDELDYAVSASFAEKDFASKNVGINKDIVIDSIVLSGADADNYTVNPVGTSTAKITRLDSVTWTGAGDGINWFDPQNWAGGAIPDLGNVANVIIPTGVTVVFDNTALSGLAEAGPVSLDTLTGTLDVDTVASASDAALAMNAGFLVIGESLSLDTLNQSGGAITGAGNVTIHDSFSQTDGSIAMDGDVSIHQGNGDLSFVSLSGANIDLTAVNGSILAGLIDASADLDLTASDDVVFQDLVNVGGNLTVNADSDDDGNGGISQEEGAALTVAGNTTLAASEDIVLDDPGNDFTGTVSGTTGGNMSLADANDLTLGVIETGGDLTVAAGDDVSFTQDVTVGGNADITADANGNGTGGITQDDGAALTIGGDTTLQAAQDIVLDNPANDFGGTVSGSTDGDMSLADTNDLTLGEVTTGGDLTVAAGDNVSFTENVTVGGNADITADANGNGTGGITQEDDAALTIGGDTTLDATQDIVLDNPANDFTGPVSGTTDGDLSLADANDLNLGKIETGGDLTVGAGDDVNFTDTVNVGGNADVTADTNGDGNGGITQDPNANLTIGGDTTLDASEDIVLDNPANDFTGSVSGTTDGDLSLADANDLDLGTIDAGGDFTVNAGGDVNGSETITVGGNTDVNAGGNVSLTNPGNSFGGEVQVDAGGTIDVPAKPDAMTEEVRESVEQTASFLQLSNRLAQFVYPMNRDIRVDVMEIFYDLQQPWEDVLVEEELQD